MQFKAEQITEVEVCVYDIVRFLDPWDKVSVVEAEVVEVEGQFIAVDYQGSFVVLSPRSLNGMHEVYQY